MEIIDNVNVKINVNQPSLKTSVDIPDVNIKTKIQTLITETEYERDYNKLLNIPTINGVEVKGNKIIEDFEVHTSELINDGEGQSPFATEDYVEQNGGKIDKILLNDNEQAIDNKTVNLRITKATVGLNNANNTSDMDKPVSNAQANAINAVQSNLDDHLIDYNNPHKVNKTQIGLSNVDNTSDLDKPISTQTQAALDELEDTIVKNINPDLEALSADIEEVSTKLQQEMNTRVQEHTEIQNDITTINSKIPNQASSTNQLADKDFVNSAINSNVAFFKGNFATYADLMAVQWQTVNNTLTTYVTNNDYAYVESDETHDNEAWRYIYVKDNAVSEWQPQFRVNETPFTQAQLDAINSGATADLINSINSKLTQDAIVDETGDSSLKAISQRAATLGLNTVQSNLNTHISNTNNPHNVTKAQLGLGNVNNTSDLDKPISNAVRTALNDYLALSGGTVTGEVTFTNTNGFKYTGIEQGSSNSYSSVWFADSGIIGKPVYDPNFIYNPSSQTLQIGKIQTTKGAIVKGRAYGEGNDEGLIVEFADNGYAGVILGSANARRSCLYLHGGATGTEVPEWRYIDQSGTTTKLYHPNKTGTIALVEDIPNSSTIKVYYLYGSDNRDDNLIPSSYQLNTRSMTMSLEFKSASTISVPNANEKNFVLLQTINPWSDPSGGLPSQLAYGSKLSYRTATNSNTWNGWRTIIDSSGGEITGELKVSGSINLIV